MNPDWTHAPLTVRLGTSPAAEQPERFPAVYAGLKRVIPPVLRRFFAFRVSGLEHLPERGPYIIAANHANYLDGVLLAMALPRKISFLVMPRVYRATPLHPYFHDHVGSIPVSLARPDPGAIRRALRVLEQGGVVGIFPEGPFSQDGRLVRGQPGVALVALRSGVPSCPPRSRAPYAALAARRFFVPRRVPLSVRFGTPLHFARRVAARDAAAVAPTSPVGSWRRSRRSCASRGSPAPGRRPPMTEPAPGEPWGGRFTEPADPAAGPSRRPCPSTTGSGPTTSTAARRGRAPSRKGGVCQEAELDAILRGPRRGAGRARERRASPTGSSSRTST